MSAWTVSRDTQMYAMYIAWWHLLITLINGLWSNELHRLWRINKWINEEFSQKVRHYSYHEIFIHKGHLLRSINVNKRDKTIFIWITLLTYKNIFSAKVVHQKQTISQTRGSAKRQSTNSTETLECLISLRNRSSLAIAMQPLIAFISANANAFSTWLVLLSCPTNANVHTFLLLTGNIIPKTKEETLQTTTTVTRHVCICAYKCRSASST